MSDENVVFMYFFAVKVDGSDVKLGISLHENLFTDFILFSALKGLEKQMKTLRKRHRVHIALGHSLQGIHDLDYTENTMRSVTVKVHNLNKNIEQ